jgi:hypothetical protein
MMQYEKTNKSNPEDHWQNTLYNKSKKKIQKRAYLPSNRHSNSMKSSSFRGEENILYAGVFWEAFGLPKYSF